MERPSDPIDFEVRLYGTVDEEEVPELSQLALVAASKLGRVTNKQTLVIRIGSSESMPAINDQTGKNIRFRKMRIKRDELDPMLFDMGRLILRSRGEKGLSQKTLSELTGISIGTLSAYESGTHPETGRPSRPRFEFVQRLSEALDIDLPTLATMAGYEVLDETAKD